MAGAPAPTKWMYGQPITVFVLMLMGMGDRRSVISRSKCRLKRGFVAVFLCCGDPVGLFLASVPVRPQIWHVVPVRIFVLNDASAGPCQTSLGSRTAPLGKSLARRPRSTQINLSVNYAARLHFHAARPTTKNGSALQKRRRSTHSITPRGCLKGENKASKKLSVTATGWISTPQSQRHTNANEIAHFAPRRCSPRI